MFTRAIVCPPTVNFATGLTSARLGEPEHARALAQHEAYCATLEQCDLSLTWLDGDQRYPDCTFVEDCAVVTERCAILTRPGAVTRRGEVARVREQLGQFYPELHCIDEPGTLDGGDVCEAGNHFFIGISERTNEAGAQQLSRLLAAFDYTCSCIDIRNTKRLLHLKSGLAFLGDNRLVVVQALRNREEFQSYTIIDVPAGEEYAANCVRLNNRVLIAAGHPGFEASLRERGYEMIALDMTEFRKMDGGLSCLSLRF